MRDLSDRILSYQHPASYTGDKVLFPLLLLRGFLLVFPALPSTDLATLLPAKIVPENPRS